MPRELGHMVALGCCSVRAKRSPTCQLWRAAGFRPRGPSEEATSPKPWQRPSRLDRKAWSKEEGVRAGGRAGQGVGEGFVTSRKAHHFAEI